MDYDVTQMIDILADQSAKYQNLSLTPTTSSASETLKLFETLFDLSDEILVFGLNELNPAIQNLKPYLKPQGGKFQLRNQQIVFQKGFKGIWSVPFTDRGIFVGKITLQNFKILELPSLFTEATISQNIGAGINQKAVRYIKRKDLSDDVFFLIHRELDRNPVFISSAENCKSILITFLNSITISEPYLARLKETVKQITPQNLTDDLTEDSK